MSNYFDSEGGAGSAMEMTTAGDGNEQWRLNLFMCGGGGGWWCRDDIWLYFF